MAPSTVGTFLRSFTWGHVRVGETIRRVRRAGARSLLIIGFGELAVLVWWGWLNRTGFPGDSIGWEIMESWED